MNHTIFCNTNKIITQEDTFPAIVGGRYIAISHTMGLDNREWHTRNLSGKFDRLQLQGRQVYM